MISVIIPSYTCSDYLDLCLKSILDNQTEPNEIIAVIDGFPSKYNEVIKKYSNDVTFKIYEENVGMQTAINTGVYMANNEKILIVNDDNVFGKNWDEVLNEIYNRDSVITINQIVSDTPGMFNFDVQNFGRNLNEFNYKEFIEFEFSIRRNVEKDNGGIFPFLISKNNFMIVNGFDEGYGSPHVCDWDFFLKLELLGCKFFRTYRMSLYHFDGKSTKNRDDQNEELIREFYMRETSARNYFKEKWGFPPTNKYNNSHSPIDSTTIKGVYYE